MELKTGVKPESRSDRLYIWWWHFKEKTKNAISNLWWKIQFWAEVAGVGLLVIGATVLMVATVIFVILAVLLVFALFALFLASPVLIIMYVAKLMFGGG